MRLHVPLLVALGTVGLLGGCHAVFGLDELKVDGGGGAGGSGSAVGGDSAGGGGGGDAECETGADCPGIETGCRKRACPAGTCGFVDVPRATACIDDGGQFCNGNGDCVGCLDSSHCTAPDTCSEATGTCVGPACKNGVKDGNETDVDCGGGACLACANGKGCDDGDDCQSGTCNAATKLCEPCGVGGCTGDRFCEGGTCVPLKAQGAICTGATQCASGHCVDGVCCNSSCSGPCRSCSPMGNCGNAMPYTDPDNDCSGARECNGGGQCAWPDGFPCTVASECIAFICDMGSCNGDPI